MPLLPSQAKMLMAAAKAGGTPVRMWTSATVRSMGAAGLVEVVGARIHVTDEGRAKLAAEAASGAMRVRREGSMPRQQLMSQHAQALRLLRRGRDVAMRGPSDREEWHADTIRFLRDCHAD